MPPKRRPEQFDKTAVPKAKTHGLNSRSSRSNPAPKRVTTSENGSQRSSPQWRLPKSASAPDYKTKIEALWKTMGNGRIGERQNAIKNGLMADPNKRTTLANAIRVVGTCQDMCPEYERIQRIRENAVDRAEKVTIHSGAKVADESRMVKAFHRPDAGKEEQLPSDLRSPRVLQKTVRYLLDKVASPSTSLAEHHKFVWDRTRCIRNDFTIQASGRLEDIRIAIECYEEIARFHILSLHQMPKIGKHDYDAQQELEQLSATLLTLFEYYDDNRHKYTAPREAEFRAYKLLMDIRSRTNDTLERVQTWPPQVRDSIQVQLAVQLCQASGNIFTNTASMLSPYSRAVQVEQAQYEKFWSILESPKVDYLMACAASVSFNEVRARALETISKVYRSGPQSRLQDISLEELTFSLGLDSKSQTRRLFRETGLHVSKHVNGVSYLDLDELSGPLPKEAIATADQIFSKSIVEVKREDRVFSAIYSGHGVTYCKENGLIDESEGEAEFEPDMEDVDSDDEEDAELFVDGAELDNDEDFDQLADKPAEQTNPFSSTVQVKTGGSSGSSAFGGFGQVPNATPSTDTSRPTSNPFASGNPFAKPSTSTNVSSQAGPPSFLTNNSSPFGQAPKMPGLFSSPPSNSTQPGKAAAPLFPFKPADNSSKLESTWKPLPVSGPSIFGVSAEQTESAQSHTSQTTEQTETKNADQRPNLEPVAKKPLFPFTFPPNPNFGTESSSKEPSTSEKALTTVKLPAETSTTDSSAPLFSSPKMATVNSSSSALKVDPMAATSNGVDSQASTSQTPTTPSANIFPSSNAPSLVQSAPLAGSTRPPKPTFSFNPPTEQPKVDIAPAASPEKTTTMGNPLVSEAPAKPEITPQQKDKILRMIAKEIVLGDYGILEQFIEAEMGPIYDKAQRKVTKERRDARLKEIKHSLLGCKYLHAWKHRVDKKISKKRAIERRQRMRQSQREDFSREQSVSRASSHSNEATINQINNNLNYLTRGFEETFDKSTSIQLLSPSQKRPALILEDANGRSSLMMSGAKASNPTAMRESKQSRHSRSQTVDSSVQGLSIPTSSSSMPPPNRSFKSTSQAQHNISELRPYVGTGFLQNEALRREAIGFARRSGSATTTSSDYFRLKARNIDPDTRAVPSTRKRGRDSNEGISNGFTSKSRRLSESTTSTISLSESTRELLARSNISESVRALVNGNQETESSSVRSSVTPRYTNDEEDLFEAARKLRETLAEETEWMKEMREAQEKEDRGLKAETPAQRKLREFKATPSKTSIRLRQTYANGLLPHDFFEKQDAVKELQRPKVGSKDTIPDTPTPKMGLAALSNDKHQFGSSNLLQDSTIRGASKDDAIEL